MAVDIARFTMVAFFFPMLSLGCVNRAGLDDFSRYLLPDDDGVPTGGAVKVTFLGTTMLLFDDGETQLLVDGFISRPPLRKVAFTRIETDSKAVDEVLKNLDLHRLKAVLVTHSHYDHALDAAYIVQRKNSCLYGSESTLNIGYGAGLHNGQMKTYEPGKKLEFGKFSVWVLDSRHSPPTWLNDDLGEVIDEPLLQPARWSAYKEGGSFDILIEHGGRGMLVKPGAHYIPGGLDGVQADVLFLGTGRLGKQSEAFQSAFYEETVAKVRPRLVIPIHWDYFFTPLSEDLVMPGGLVDNVPEGFNRLIRRLKDDRIQFGIMQGLQSVLLFADETPAE